MMIHVPAGYQLTTDGRIINVGPEFEQPFHRLTPTAEPVIFIMPDIKQLTEGYGEG